MSPDALSSQSDAAPVRKPISYNAELVRKAIHLLALVIPASVLWFGKWPALTIWAPFAVFALIADVSRVRFHGVNKFVRLIFGWIMRDEEKPAVGSGPVINGATWVLISASLTILLFPEPIAVAAFSMFMIADAAAAIFGRRFGKHKWGSHGRTVEGTLAFVVMALAVGLGLGAILPMLSWVQVVVSTPFAAAAEAVPEPLNDNLRVPLITGLVMWLVLFLL